MPEIYIRSKTNADGDWSKKLCADQWGAETVVAHGEVFHPAELEGLVAWLENERAGLLTYHIQNKALEIVTLNALLAGRGIGGLLIERAREIAVQKGCERLRLITTNDNTQALRFYQKKGFLIRVLRPGVMEEYRNIKPEIPLIGEDGIPIRDEIELELPL